MANEEKRLPTKAIAEVSIGAKSESDLASRTEKGDGKPSYTVKEIVERFVTLKEAQKRLSLAHGQYTRRLLKEGKLEGIKVTLKGGPRWLVSTDSIDRYDLERKAYTTLRNVTVKVDPKHFDALVKFLKGLDPLYSAEYAYEKANKAASGDEEVWASVIESVS